MCGIAGFYNHKSSVLESSLLDKMLLSVDSRGPDDKGKYFHKNIGLGHQRLKIIDLSNNASQPMVDKELGLVLVYNGEIYNFLELKKLLLSKGYAFKSQSDSEVIIKAYAAFGEEFLHELKGMFAFALWDEKKEKLLLARDRMGIKPLYYASTPAGFIFSSTLPSLLHFGGIDTSIDKTALQFYLTFHAVPEPLTLLKGIKKLRPGTLLTIDSAGDVTQKTYWKFSLNEQKTKKNLSESNWLDLTYKALHEATKQQLIADVPVGILLSGGLDSSLLVALATNILSKPIDTFTIGFENIGNEIGNEFYYSNYVAKLFNTKHHQLTVSNKQIIDSLPKCVAAMSEPMMSHDNIGFYLISQEVSKYLKVVLSGQGADEIFAGYKWFRPSSEKFIQPSQFILNSLADFSLFSYNQMVTEDYKTPYIADIFLDEMCVNNGSLNPLDNLLVYESTYGFSNGPLSRLDNMSMASSLEARVPFLDEKVVDLALSMPQKYKTANNGKYILKELGKRLLPDELLHRQKGYFCVPIFTQVNKNFMDLTKNILSASAIKKRGIFNEKYIQTLFEQEQLGAKSPTGGSRLWQIAILEYWLQIQGL